MSYVLQTNEVSKSYSGKLAVDHVSIGVRVGDIYGFIGENGAGKTTLMRMVCGLAKPTSGEITLFGSKDLESQRYRMGSTIENPALYPTMTAMENMEAQSILLGMKNTKKCAEILDLVRLGETNKKKAKNFSLGMKQRLMIGLALIAEPEFLVLDEPINGLDPMGIKEVRDLLLHLNEYKGMTILISSHILGELEKIATRYGIISNGKMVDEFRADDLSERCGKNLVINTSDPAKTQEIISRMYEKAAFEQASENAVILKGHVNDAWNINEQLVRAGIKVNTLASDGKSLEDYLMGLMVGGKQYA